MPCTLTNKLVTAEPAPEKGTRTVWDDEIKGFGVRIYAPTPRNPDGERSFFLGYRVDGVERRITIGRFGPNEWSVAAARVRAKELRRRVDGGDDPAAQRRERREAPTIKELIDRYETEVIPKKRLTEAFRLNDEKKMLGLILAELGANTKVADVHMGDIEQMHANLTQARGPVRANRILAIASKAFSRSLMPIAGENAVWRNQAQGNPCKGVAKNYEGDDRGIMYTPVQLVAITEALDAYQGQVAADCVRLIMLTGCRPGEAMKAKWTEFDREAAVWTKPSSHTKQKREHRAALSAAALELIERLRRGRSGNSPYLFPGDAPDAPIATLRHIWMFVRERASLPPTARLYDCRHTYARVGASNGLSLPIIGALLGHATPRTTQRYAKFLADDPMQAAANLIGDALAGSIGPKPPEDSESPVGASKI